MKPIRTVAMTPARDLSGTSAQHLPTGGALRSAEVNAVSSAHLGRWGALRSAEVMTTRNRSQETS